MPYFVAIFLITMGVVLGVKATYNAHFSHPSVTAVTAQGSSDNVSVNNREMPAACDNAHFVQDRQWFNQNYMHLDTKVTFPEHICGEVMRVFPERDTKSGTHGYFLMRSGADNQYIRVVSNLDEMGGNWPWVQVGDKVEVQGRYYFDNTREQGIDWTHHGISRQWPWSGFVKVNGEIHQ